MAFRPKWICRKSGVAATEVDSMEIEVHSVFFGLRTQNPIFNPKTRINCWWDGLNETKYRKNLVGQFLTWRIIYVNNCPTTTNAIRPVLALIMTKFWIIFGWYCNNERLRLNSRNPIERGGLQVLTHQTVVQPYSSFAVNQTCYRWWWRRGWLKPTMLGKLRNTTLVCGFASPERY